MPQPEITVYITEWCPDCRRARQFLDERRIPYRLVNIDRDAQGEQFVLQVNNGLRRVPTIVFDDGTILVEPSPSQLAQKFAPGK